MFERTLFKVKVCSVLFHVSPEAVRCETDDGNNLMPSTNTAQIQYKSVFLVLYPNICVLSYVPLFSDKVKKTGQVVRCICLMDHPIPNTKDALSTQVT